MTIVGKFKGVSLALALGATTLITAPAEARGLGGGLAAGLLGGIALGMIASAASAQAAQAPVYIVEPSEAPMIEEVEQINRPTRSLRRAPVTPAPRRSSEQKARREAPPPRTASQGGLVSASAADSCRSSLLAAGRRYGRVLRAEATPAGASSQGSDGSTTIPINVRIEYAKESGTVVRQARVACRVRANGEVVAFRALQGSVVASR